MADAPRLEFRDIGKRYVMGASTVLAVDGVSFSIGAGEFVALYGPSGSGKSTLLRIAAGIESPEVGAVLVDGRDVTRLSARDAAHYRMHVLGWVQQDTDLDEGSTVLENAAIKHLVASPTIRAGHAKVTPILEQLGLGDRLDQRADTLSGGERQRVGIAQALSLDPRVLLADEPTGNLNSALSRDVLGLLQAETRRRGMATLLVTHDEHAVTFADKVYALRDGRLHAEDHAVTERRWA